MEPVKYESLQLATREAPDNVGDKHPDTEGKATLLLDLLGDKCWHSTAELVHEVGHRFSTSVQWLRERGHIIEKRCVGKWYEYRHVDHRVTERVCDDWKSKYYASRHWRAKRHERLAADGGKCCSCGSVENLHVHHWRYDLFDERVDDLMTLCSDCHRRIHDYDAVRLKFPTHVSQDIHDQFGTNTPPHNGNDEAAANGMLFDISPDEGIGL